jgi:hypothetical protein
MGCCVLPGAVAVFSTALMSFSHCLFVYVMGKKTRNAIKCDREAMEKRQKIERDEVNKRQGSLNAPKVWLLAGEK